MGTKIKEFKEYIPTEWNTGDIITASGLNKIEQELVTLEQSFYAGPAPDGITLENLGGAIFIKGIWYKIEAPDVTKNYVDLQVETLQNAKQDKSSLGKDVENAGFRTATSQDTIDQNIREVAEGKCKSYTIALEQNPTFNSQELTVSVDEIITIDGETISTKSLKRGDVILIRDINVPDRWFDSETNFNILETTKVNLQAYRTSAEQDVIDATKQDKIQIIELSGTSGTLTDEQYNLIKLKTTKVSRSDVIYNYQFSSSADDHINYFSHDGLNTYYIRIESDKTWTYKPVNLETTVNKTTSLSASSTDTQYPSAKCVYDLISGVEQDLKDLNGN